MQAIEFTPVDGLDIEYSSGIARIRLDQPTRKNAVTLAMWNGLSDCLSSLAARPELRAIILTGAGENFSAGADISEFDSERGDARSARNYEAANSRAFAAVRTCPVPVIAAIRGICFGGGFGLAAAADIRIATQEAVFSVPAARLGLAYPQDAMIDIVSSIGPQMARFLTYTGARIDAAQALSAGFLLEVAESERLELRAEELATAIATNAPLSVRASKLAIAATLGGDAAAVLSARLAGDATFESADYAEGRTAFKERRPPAFKGV